MTTVHPFPIAPHSYFRVRNMEQAYADFRSNPSEGPKFLYTSLDIDEVDDRILKVSPGSREHKVLRMVRVALRLRDSADRGVLSEYRELNSELYREPTAKEVMTILAKTKQKARELSLDSHWREIEKITGDIDEGAISGIYRPDEELFLRLSSYLARYARIDELHDNSLETMMHKALDLSGLTEKGWRLRVLNSSVHASVNHAKKFVSVGRNYESRNDEGRIKIVLHEIYGHALKGQVDSIAESEGFAGVLEQLASAEYRTFRSYRYLAGALGWGVLGKPMNFNEVYEVLWRVIEIGGRYTGEDAKKYAFIECSRVFRGANPSVAGAVFLKDTMYYTGNILVWKALEKSNPSYEEFCEMIEGKRKVLF